MADTMSVQKANHESAKKESQFIAIMKRLASNKLAMFGLFVLIIVVLVAIFAPILSPYSPDYIDRNAYNQRASAEHLLGTDVMGRDLLSRLIYGARYSLGLSFSSVLLSLLCGVIIGAIAGYFGGAVDQVIMRLTDVIQAIPGVLLNMALVCVLGQGVFNTILALGISGIANNIRMMRASILKVRKMEYLDAAASINCSSTRIIAKHVLPNAFSPMIVSSTMSVGSVMLNAAALSYLGLGVPLGTPEWGSMLNAGRDYIMSRPELTVLPGLCIILVVLAINLLGDGLRDAMDPRLKK